jgi:hypothetical protein
VPAGARETPQLDGSYRRRVETMARSAATKFHGGAKAEAEGARAAGQSQVEKLADQYTERMRQALTSFTVDLVACLCAVARADTPVLTQNMRAHDDLEAATRHVRDLATRARHSHMPTTAQILSVDLASVMQATAALWANAVSREDLDTARREAEVRLKESLLGLCRTAWAQVTVDIVAAPFGSGETPSEDDARAIHHALVDVFDDALAGAMPQVRPPGEALCAELQDLGGAWATAMAKLGRQLHVEEAATRSRVQSLHRSRVTSGRASPSAEQLAWLARTPRSPVGALAFYTRDNFTALYTQLKHDEQSRSDRPLF